MASSGNFCTLNPLTEYDARVNRGNYSNGNLTYDDVGGDGWVTNMAMTHKTYCEYRIDGLGGYGGVQGLRGTQAASQVYDSVTFQASYQSGRIYHYKGDSDQSYSGNIGGTVSSGNIIMFAYDPATYKWWVGVNGTWRNSGDPANGTGYVFQGSATMFENMNVTWGGWSGDINRLDHTWNFGQDSTFGGQETAGGNADGNGFGDFAYAPPTGFLALCSGNMSIGTGIDPAGDDGADNNPKKQFFMTEYLGNLSDRTITTENQADLILIRHTNYAQNWYVVDSNRGITNNYYTKLDTNAAEATFPQSNFQSVGATSVGISGGTWLNSTGAYYQMWMWHCNGGTTTSDSSGDITVTRQTNDDSKFTIATWTGNGSSGSTIAHGLGVKPAMTWIKKRNATAAHGVWHQGYNNGDYDSFGELLGDAAWYANQGSNGHFAAAPGTDYLTLTAYGQVNTSSDTYVGYFWADVEGMQKFGSYQGNGNADGPFIYLGFRPAMIFFKRTDSTSGWTVVDTHRYTYNDANGPGRLEFNLNNAETTGSSALREMDVLSNGIKIRTSNSNINTDGGDYIFGAWADVPFKYNNAR